MDSISRKELRVNGQHDEVERAIRQAAHGLAERVFPDAIRFGEYTDPNHGGPTRKPHLTPKIKWVKGGAVIEATGTAAEWKERGHLWEEFCGRLHDAGFVDDAEEATTNRGPRTWESMLTRDLQSVQGWKRKEIKQLIADIYRRINPSIKQGEIDDLENRIDSYCTYWNREGFERPDM